MQGLNKYTIRVARNIVEFYNELPDNDDESKDKCYMGVGEITEPKSTSQV